MTDHTAPDELLADVLAELTALEDPKMRAANEKRGDDHGIHLSKLRALAKKIKLNHPFAAQLWATGQTAPRLLALLVCKPREFTVDELDTMLREPVAPKVYEWFVSYVVKKSPHADELRARWFDDPNPTVAAAAWSLTAERVWRRPEGIDLGALLDQIELEMTDAPSRLQWAMNETLAQIGIHHLDLRGRAIAIGERLQVLADYPTSPGCISPFAPIWIDEMGRRHDEQLAAKTAASVG